MFGSIFQLITNQAELTFHKALRTTSCCRRKPFADSWSSCPRRMWSHPAKLLQRAKERGNPAKDLLFQGGRSRLFSKSTSPRKLNMHVVASILRNPCRSFASTDKLQLLRRIVLDAQCFIWPCWKHPECASCTTPVLNNTLSATFAAERRCILYRDGGVHRYC